MLLAGMMAAPGLLGGTDAPPGNPAAGAASLTRAIESAREDAAEPFRLRVDCSDAAGIRSLTVYRGRVAVLDGKTQVRLADADRDALLQRLLDAGFPGLEARYGGRRKASKEEAALKVTCRVALDVAGLQKSSVQLLQGEQSEALLGLADALLGVVAPLTADGVGASSLEDGLAKLAERQLAPEVLALRLVSLPPEPASGDGFILRIEAGEMTRQSYAPGRRIGAPTARPLTESATASIAASLRAAPVWALPLNLRGEAPVELEVAVLDQRRTVFARPGFPPADAGRQAAFERLLEALGCLPDDCPSGRGSERAAEQTGR